MQTPTLAIIAMREEEIRNFKPKDYFGISVQAGEVQWTWKDTRSGSFRTFQKEKAEEIQRTVQNGQMEITSVVKKPKKTMAPGLYDLTTLQREANQKYGFSAKETLNIMQRLYENHKVLTYPRTDSRYIGKDVVPTIKERLKPAEQDHIANWQVHCSVSQFIQMEVLWTIRRSVTIMRSFRQSSLCSWII